MKVLKNYYEDRYTTSNELEKVLYEIIQVSIEGLPSRLDSDSISIVQETTNKRNVYLMVTI